MDFSCIPELKSAPDPLALCREARLAGGFFGNAQSTDQLRVSLTARARVCRRAGGGKAVDLAFDARGQRSSDGKETLVSSCRKIAAGQPESDGEEWLRRLLSARG